MKQLKMGRMLTLGILLLACALPQRSWGEDLPLPRMASVQADRAYVRAGPGKRYPIKWVFRREHMPVEIVAEYEDWRKIRDWEGGEGWMHKSLLSSRRSVIFIGEEQVMHSRANAESPAMARLAPELVALLSECGILWCQVSVQGYKGWIKRTGVWGLYNHELIE